MELLKKNGIIYSLNIFLFIVIVYGIPTIKNIGISVLILTLVGSYLFIKQNNTKDNILKIRSVSLSVNSMILLFLFGSLLIMHWLEHDIMEKFYLIIFCTIQVLALKIPIAQSQKD